MVWIFQILFIDMKKCSSCKIEKSVAEFNTDVSRKDNLSLFCKLCSRKKTQYAYRKNRKYYISKSIERNNKTIEFIRFIKETSPCFDCGIKYPYYVMDFDHRIDEEKKFCIGHHRFYGKQQLIDEIKKCDIVCSNCHRIRTHNCK